MSVASKLQIKPGHTVVVLSTPDGLDMDVTGVDEVAGAESADAILVFVRTTADLGTPEVEAVVDAARNDRLAWVAYPKGGQLGTDLNRDSLAALLTERGVRAVRQISIDDTWSALRFRAGATGA